MNSDEYRDSWLTQMQRVNDRLRKTHKQDIASSSSKAQGLLWKMRKKICKIECRVTEYHSLYLIQAFTHYNMVNCIGTTQVQAYQRSIKNSGCAQKVQSFNNEPLATDRLRERKNHCISQVPCVEVGRSEWTDPYAQSQRQALLTKKMKRHEHKDRFVGRGEIIQGQ